MNPSLKQAALREFSNLASDEAVAILDAAERKRRQTRAICYWTPFPRQRQVISSFVANKKIFGILGGNRSAKTETACFLAVVWALGKEFFRGEPIWDVVKDLPVPDPPNNIWIVGLDFSNMIEQIIWREKLVQGRGHGGLIPKDPKICTIKDADHQAFFTNGSVITCKSADSGREKFQGASVDLVVIDEEPEEEIYDECYQRTIDCGGKIVVALTPLTDASSGVRTPWVYNLYQQFRQGKKDVHFEQISVLDNPYVPDDEKEKLKEKWAGHAEERARIYGDFIRRSGLVYNLWTPDKHLIKPIPIDQSWQRIVCIDPASTGVTAALWCAVHPNRDLYFYREYYQSDQVISEHAKNILVYNAGNQIDIWLLDPKFGAQRNPETHRTNLQLYRDAGIPARLASVDEDYGLNASLEYIAATTIPNSRHPKAYFFNDLESFKFEIERYHWDSYQKGPMKGLTKEKPQKRSDHLMNCFQYVCAQRPRGNRHSIVPLGDRDLLAQASNNSYT